MQLPKLTKLGLCNDCEKWFEIEEDDSALPIHISKENDMKCHNSKMMPWKYQYVIKTTDEAREVIKFIRDDNDDCLVRYLSNRKHSMVCNDGKDCAKKRLLFAQALALYCQENFLQ